jgi:CDP-glycerol glycerophosphotransferase (TagB/SpsB family)
LVNNSTFGSDFAKRPEQVYVNTWHGTPLKRMGYDIPGGVHGARNVVRNLLQADYLISASPLMTQRLYAQAYRMAGIHPGVVVEEGYPRVDRQAMSLAQARQALAAAGVAVTASKVVLYAPTWRGASFHDPRDDSALLAERVSRLSERLGPEWEVLVRAHQAVFAAAREHPDLRGALVDNDIPANVVLAGSDVLVADYSSIMVDFLALDRPIVLLTPDRDEYDQARGLYEGPQWPGPVHHDIDGVAEAVAATGGGADTHADQRREMRDLMCPYEDGRSAERVVDVVFAGTRRGRRIVDLAAQRRPSLLLYIGALKPNGMTTSAVNLLNTLDHGRYDVTALYAFRNDPQQAAVLDSIDRRVRLVARFGAINGSKALQAVRHVLQRRGVPALLGEPPLAGLFRDEWVRCLGNARFDVVVDFIGYGAFTDLLLLQGGARRTAIWLHNDMVADSRRLVAGRQPLRRPLEAVFTTYRFFDALVSVSPALRDVNRRRLARFAPAGRFIDAHNVVDARAVLARAAAPPEWQPDPAPGTTTFVASGRLSHAKNFPRLVSAFALVHRENPDTRVVILGEGPDRAALEAHIERLGLSGSVLLAGHVDNPFPVMAVADCFVMTSDHEGQPMVILEALVLGLPVVVTRFDSVESALPPGEGLIVPRSTEGVAEGMRAFLRGEVPPARFDPDAYNREAVSQFVAAVGLEDGAGEG